MKNQNDTLQRFLMGNGQVRGEIIHLNDTYQAISDRHPYPELIRNLLGEGLAATALLCATLKFEGSLILQIEGEGPLNLLVVQGDEKLQLRGLAQWEGDITAKSFNEIVGAGKLAITITPKRSQRYQGIVPLAGGSIAASLETYFQQSEQLPTFLFIAADEEVAVGMLLQLMPEGDAEYWNHIVHLARTITAKELAELTTDALLTRLFYEEEIHLFAEKPVVFQCNCTQERMENAVLLMGKQEATDILRENKTIIVTCEFCNNYYEFSKTDVARIFSQTYH